MNNLTHYVKPKSLKGKSVGLIVPPSPFLLDERVFVSLGILKVASVLESAQVQVGVLDLSGVSNVEEAVKAYLEKAKIDWVGITVTTPQLPAAVKLAKIIRKINPKLRMVLGGPHVTLTYSAVKVEESRGIIEGRARKAANLLESYFDVLVSGDGELIVFELFKDSCPKVLDADNHKGPYFMNDEIFDKSPMPSRHLVDMESYKYSIDGFNATSLIAQLGCPFHCGFCGGRNSKSLRLIRQRTEQSIIDEIRHLYETYGYTGYMFYDDELNVNKNFVSLMNDLHKLQLELGVEFRLRGFIKAELFNEVQAEAMYRAGFRWILSGFEAADPRILVNIDKVATLEDNSRVVEISHKYGLKVKALMSVGHPGESRQSILAIKDWLIKMKVDDFDCTVITTYPGTPYYDLAVPHLEQKGVWVYTHSKTKDILYSYEIDHTEVADYYKGNPDGGYSAFVFTDNLSSKEIVELRDFVEKEVREKLHIKFNPGKSGIKFEHSMGQGLPEMLYKESRATSLD